MHVIIAGELYFEGDVCAEVIRTGAAYIAASQAEDGCIAYNWSVDVLRTGVMYVYEEWASEEALGKHFQDPSYAAMRDHLAKFPIKDFAIQMYSAGQIVPVYEDGQPRKVIFGVKVAD